MTTTQLLPGEWRGFTPQGPMLMLGSCFTTEVGALLAAGGMDICINPTGNVFNPLSAAKTLLNLAQGRRYAEDELFENQGLWRSFDHHTRLASPDRAQALELVNRAMELGQNAFNRAREVIVTFGTAYVFERQERVVCNCHKLPHREFVRRRLSIDEIADAWQPIIDRWSDKRFTFTVSPIRHKADGLHGNQLSKATLLLAVDALHGCQYFPAYEIMLDQLRDYRWYADDGVHPSAEAVAHIHRLFRESTSGL